jgi:hypothetical protein
MMTSAVDEKGAVNKQAGKVSLEHVKLSVMSMDHMSLRSSWLSINRHSPGSAGRYWRISYTTPSYVSAKTSKYTSPPPQPAAEQAASYAWRLKLG